MAHTLLVVGETALELAVELPPGFFFLILMPGTGAEFKASRNPVHSIAAGRRHEIGVRHSSYTINCNCSFVLNSR